ncbi:GNAT family N-acetyltransferase [Azospirillum sp. RWY-5-1]|uniref:GNAT family N-acetyltransferase n=1 Tax=Azospirillum oleiclasticum TaxID=2735135 RepID=A0ABX2T415_9PROT|nr:GNAT family N-acetyltransferase [Azospirillum oleiclasticum]NYZ11904.1 GNAT family N-acetyltransferase [Azospirillum oleiclasticum]NYZ19064.1 GNAT family N-acetyltransferase [Azospirillum oleiclasticum]
MPIRSADATIRPAEPDDAADVARFVTMAGGGVYEFLLDGLVPGVAAAEMLTPGIAGRSGSFSHRQCAVAVCGDRIVGAVHAYPTDWMRDADRSFLPQDRLDHLAAFDRTQDWGSYFLSAIAVHRDHRRAGHALRLLDWAYGRARTGGFSRMSLHVWADNLAARRLYEAQGFAELAHVPVPWHPRLPREGGCILMGRGV